MSHESEPVEEANIRSELELPRLIVRGGESRVFDIDVHSGAIDDLTMDPRFEDLVSYWFADISTMLMRFLRFLNGLVGNFGVAIILMTILIKGMLFPLTRRQQRSMHAYQKKMQRVQPKIRAIQARYKDDRTKLNEELMKFYRENGVAPPLGGCLPIFLQMPIFIGLFNALRYAIDLRFEPFLYITDLSQPDRLFELPFHLPWPLSSSDLNLLPILMIITWFFQQRLMPRSEDPQVQQQQKMMQFMPIIFGLLFYTMPSGLVLYWMTSTGIGIIEQLYIKKRLEVEPEEVPSYRESGKGSPSRKGASPKKGPAPGAGGKKPVKRARGKKSRR